MNRDDELRVISGSESKIVGSGSASYAARIRLNISNQDITHSDYNKNVHSLPNI